MFSAVESVEIHENLSLQQENESEYLIPEFRRSPKLGNSVISAIMSGKLSEALTEKLAINGIKTTLYLADT